MKKALVTGASGQVGSFLCEKLLGKGFEVHGLNRRKSQDDHKNLEWAMKQKNFRLIEGDVADAYSIGKIISSNAYDQIYNMAAQSHVHTSFNEPSLTFTVNTIGVLNILEAIRTSSPKTRFYQASTSEMFGDSPPPHNEDSIFSPRSPYAIAKLAAHILVRNYREGYGLKASCGIMFNTESHRRGDNFVTKKITNWVKEYWQWDSMHWAGKSLLLGNLDSKRAWMHVEDAINGIYRVCNQEEFNKKFVKYQDYCFGSNEVHTVRDFLRKAMIRKVAEKNNHEGGYTISEELLKRSEERFENCYKFIGKGMEERMVVSFDKRKKLVAVAKEFFRPTDVVHLQCDSTKIQKDLGWKQERNLDDILETMLRD